jgi:NTP pyrophosphatase (non-canonical NTP hydrolase)
LVAAGNRKTPYGEMRMTTTNAIDRDRIIEAGPLKQLAKEIHETAVNSGWWEDRDKLMGTTDSINDPLTLRAKRQLVRGTYGRLMVEASMLMLTVSELAEGMEGLRKDLPDDHMPQFKMIECELADAMIRILDHSHAFGYRVPEAMLAKMEYNKNRPHKHGGKAF